MVQAELLVTRRQPEAVKAMLTQSLSAVHDTADKRLKAAPSSRDAVLPTLTGVIAVPRDLVDGRQPHDRVN